MKSLAFQAALQQSFESLKENEERHASGLDDDNWDPVYRDAISASSNPQLGKSIAFLEDEA